MPSNGLLADAVLRRGKAVLVLGLESVHTGDDLLQSARRLGEQMREAGHGRVASTLRTAEEVVVALLAAEATGTELVLLRDLGGKDPSSLAREVAATALLGEGLQIREVSGDRRVPGRFRILLTTSGTTGRPKVASHSLERLAGRVRRSSSDASEARWLLTYAPASFAGIQVILTALLLDGVLIASGEPQITRLVELARKHAVTHVSGTPTFWRSFLVALSEGGGLPSLRYVTLGGEVASQALLDRLHAAFPEARITHIFAATETGALFSVTDGREGFPSLWLEQGIEGVALRIQRGELLVQSPRRMEGYVQGAAGVVEDPQDWIATGDLVEVTGDRVRFRGRVDKVINVGGAKCTPEEVEGVLEQVPGVRAVRVYGAPNPISGQVVAAQIVAEAGVETAEVRKRILTRARQALAPHKVPRIITFVEAIPTTEAGKTLREDNREQARS